MHHLYNICNIADIPMTLGQRRRKNARALESHFVTLRAIKWLYSGSAFVPRPVRGRQKSRRRRKHQLRKRKASTSVTTRLVSGSFAAADNEARTTLRCVGDSAASRRGKHKTVPFKGLAYHRNSQHCPSALFTARFVTCLSRCVPTVSPPDIRVLTSEVARDEKERVGERRLMD